MGKKKRKRAVKMQQKNKPKESSYWKIVAIIALVVATGLAVKMISDSSNDVQRKGQVYQRPPSGDDALESDVKLVAFQFRCACGGCGELPLIECTCDMPRGAVEEKTFIRQKLVEGLTVEQVIQLVDKEYGHRTT